MTTPRITGYYPFPEPPPPRVPLEDGGTFTFTTDGTPVCILKDDTWDFDQGKKTYEIWKKRIEPKVKQIKREEFQQKKEQLIRWKHELDQRFSERKPGNTQGVQSIAKQSLPSIEDRTPTSKENTTNSKEQELSGLLTITRLIPKPNFDSSQLNEIYRFKENKNRPKTASVKQWIAKITQATHKWSTTPTDLLSEPMAKHLWNAWAQNRKQVNDKHRVSFIQTLMKGCLREPYEPTHFTTAMDALVIEWGENELEWGDFATTAIKQLFEALSKYVMTQEMNDSEKLKLVQLAEKVWIKIHSMPVAKEKLASNVELYGSLFAIFRNLLEGTPQSKNISKYHNELYENHISFAIKKSLIRCCKELENVSKPISKKVFQSSINIYEDASVKIFSKKESTEHPTLETARMFSFIRTIVLDQLCLALPKKTITKPHLKVIECATSHLHSKCEAEWATNESISQMYHRYWTIFARLAMEGTAEAWKYFEEEKLEDALEEILKDFNYYPVDKKKEFALLCVKAKSEKVYTSAPEQILSILHEQISSNDYQEFVEKLIGAHLVQRNLGAQKIKAARNLLKAQQEFLTTKQISILDLILKKYAEKNSETV